MFVCTTALPKMLPITITQKQSALPKAGLIKFAVLYANLFAGNRQDRRLALNLLNFLGDRRDNFKQIANNTKISF